MCYIWQEQSWELTLEVTTSHTALSQRRDNTLFGGGDVQNDHDDSNHDYFIGHDDYVWENTLMKTTLPCKTLFKTLRSLVVWINETGQWFWNWESCELPTNNTYCNAFLYIPGFKIKLNACELIKVFLWKKEAWIKWEIGPHFLLVSF